MQDTYSPPTNLADTHGITVHAEPEYSWERCVLEKALTSRFVEEALLELFSAGSLCGTVHTCIGQEMSGAVISEFLRPTDTVFSNHRCHGHFLSRHGDVEGLVAELLGRQTGVCGGIGGSQHLYKDGFFSNGVQGGTVPVAAGLAFGHKIRGRGDISAVFIGDGTLGQGVVYETLNIASKWSLPLLIILEDNKYSQSTPQSETLAGDIGSRARAFGIKVTEADTWNWRELHHKAGILVDQARRDSRPRFLHIETYRLKAHSKGDDDRPREEIETFEKRDPLNLFLADLSPEDAKWVETLRGNVKHAIDKAGLAPHTSLSQHVSMPVSVQWSVAKLPEKKRLIAALNETFHDLMREHQEMLVIGEDVLSPYGGAFKVTRGLSDLFPGRVFNTPISEACIVGLGTGLGLMGFHPFVEIMFGDFLGLAFDQIVNHAAKFQQMYNQQAVTNVVVRTPMGGGRGYGPTHSQTLDRHFLGIPGLRVLAMNSVSSPLQLYKPLLGKDVGPSLVIENKLLYGRPLRSHLPEGYELLHSDETFPCAWIRPAADRVDVTLLGYGGAGDLLVEACDLLFEEHDLIAQALVVMQIYPFNVLSYLEILRAAPSLLIVEEGQGFAGFGSEAIAQLAEAGTIAGISTHRLFPPAHCIPCSGPAEKEMLPSVTSIVEAVLKMRPHDYDCQSPTHQH